MNNQHSISKYLAKNNVVIMFLILCLGSFWVSDYTLPSLFAELFTRIGRNTFMVLSLLIPVVAGLGLNFGIVIGAIATQIAIFLVVLWGGSGFMGIIWCVLISTPLAIFFGYLVGKLFNSMKGSEMIGGLVTGYFSDGVYQFVFLFVLGGLITINNSVLMISTGVGVKNVINLDGNLQYAIDNMPMLSILDAAFWTVLGGSAVILVYRLVKKQELGLKRILRIFLPLLVLYALSYIPMVNAFLSTTRLLLLHAVEIGALAVVLRQIWQIILTRRAGDKSLPKRQLMYIAIAGAAYAMTYIPIMYASLVAVALPVLSYLLIGALCLFIEWFLNTKLGQDMRTVGHDRAVATSSGINVDRVRIVAMIMSTVLASYGHLISMQNIGTVATYGSHVSVGLYAVAALLVGGASVQHATTKHAVLGVVLFHTLFILSPNAGKALLGNAQIGEFFRLFVAYSVIALALAMHARAKRKGGQILIPAGQSSMGPIVLGRTEDTSDSE